MANLAKRLITPFALTKAGTWFLKNIGSAGSDSASVCDRLTMEGDKMAERKIGTREDWQRAQW